MASLEELITNAVVETLKKKESEDVIKIGVSARHVHLSQSDLETLFGKGHELTPKKMLMGDRTCFAIQDQKPRCVSLH